MKKYSYFLSILLLIACSQKKERQKIVEKKGFNLEKTHFNENPLQLLKSTIDSTQNTQQEYVEKGFSEAFAYPEGYIFEPWNGDNSFYGNAYYSKKTDSIAYYKDVYFDRIAFLMHYDKTVAVLAQTDLLSDTLYLYLINLLNKQYGKPTFDPQTTSDVFYEWAAPDRYLQTDYYKGISVTATSNQPLKAQEVFTVQFLIFNKNAADEIKKIQEENYKKYEIYRVMPGDFQLYSQNPTKNLTMMNEILEKKFK